jgi:prepilin-type N-terminal cleavage/methylation domain-containing protein
MRKFYFTSKIFTLIELLITIAIISILASLLLPALRKAKQNAQGVLCSKTLSQLSIAGLSYESDYNGFIVPNGSCSGSWDNWNWDLASMKNLLGYNDFSFLQCPVAISQYATPFAINGVRSTYSQNKYLGDYTNCNSHIENLAHKIKSPSKMAFVFDGCQVIASSNNYPYAYSFGYLLSLSDEKPFWCHENRGQFLFKDGHVTYKKISELEDSVNFWGN